MSLAYSHPYITTNGHLWQAIVLTVRRFVSLAARSRCEPTLTGLVSFPESRATSAYFRVTESSGRKPWRGSAAARVATVRLVKGAKNLWVNWYRPLRAATG